MIEGGLVAKTVEGKGVSVRGEDDTAGNCLNCNSPITGNFCDNCGQARHIHRSIGAFWHDILHGVLHFEGKFWRTLPLLVWKPGELTRRYVHGERANFISPMALFLFSIFMMFAVFSFIGDPFSGADSDNEWNSGVVVEARKLDGQIKAKIAQLDQAEGEQKSGIEQEILELKRARNMVATMTMSDMPHPEVGLGDDSPGIGEFDSEKDSGGDESGFASSKQTNQVSTGLRWLDMKLNGGLKKANANPSLLFYKLKANGYKFAWLLIPISLPFVWLTTIGRRGYHFYDHAVFTTYSISFMSLLFISCAVLAALGVTGEIWVGLLVFYPPFHMYRQLRYAYQMSRPEALVRVSFLLVFTVISLTLFLAILLTLGVLG